MITRNSCLFFFLLSLLPIFLTAQNSSNIWVKYDVQFYSGMVGKTGILQANRSSSIFREGTNLDDDGRISMSEDGNIVAIEKMEDTYTYMDFDDQEVKSKRTLGPDSYKVSEKLQTIEWQLITGETRNINGFKSHKAEGEFRGRTYIAWYTPDIPLRMGPWKFHGLPGLILEIQDTEGKFNWTASEIKYPYIEGNAIAEPPAKELIQTSLKEYVKLVEAHENRERSKRLARAPKGVRVVSSTSERGVELTYEWENK